MSITADYRKLLSDNVRLLGNILGQVIYQQAGPEIFGLEERMRVLTKSRRTRPDPLTDREITELVDSMSVSAQDAVARAFTSYFELINLAEENHRIRVLRERERRAEGEPLAESIEAAIANLYRTGVREEHMANLLERLDIELVFTAHPTENKRRTVLSKLRRISRTMYALDTEDLLPREREELLTKIHAEVTALWTTERSRTTKPTPKDEVRTSLYHFYATLWDIIPEVYRNMEKALAKYYPTLAVPDRFLSFGSWIGGDRDGNPFVTTHISAEAIQRYRRSAAEQHSRAAQPLSREMSMSNRLVEVTAGLEQLLERYEPDFSGHVTRLSKRYAPETYRLLTAHLVEALGAVHDEDVVGRLLGQNDAPWPPLRRRADLLEPLERLDRSLRAARLESIAETSLKDFIYQVRVFGLHTARLDVRQYSLYHRQVLAELFDKLDIAQGFEQMSPADRTALLTDQLEAPRPDLSQLTDLSDEAQETLGLFNLLHRIVDIYGSECIGPYIISMTKGPDDLLVVLLLAYWSGLCLHEDEDGSSEGLSIAPLFETRADLQAAPEIMSTLFQHPRYAKHLAGRDNQQIIMIGYSDSNKDAGYIAATWELFCAQQAIAACCQEHGVSFSLFHGRGGTIARGGGPTNRAILAQPARTVNGKLRITEQGEVIDERYGKKAIARRHLEQIVHAVLMRSAPEHKVRTLPLAKWQATMEELSQTSFSAYRRLVYETPELITYWQQATPINELSQLQIGSRPARRKGQSQADVFATLRAIPWVFSWMQSRHVLPGWYGMGTAFAAYATAEDRLENLREMYARWPFFKTALDNAQVSLSKADMGIARLYANLVEDEAVRDMIFNDIYAEFHRTRRWILEITGQEEILDNDKVLQRSIQLRNPYVDPLNFLQVSLLRQLRALPDPASAEAQSILQAVLLTINGVAAGLKNTG